MRKCFLKDLYIQYLLDDDFLIIKYIFDSEDKFELTYDELLEIIGKARLTGP